MKTSKKLKLKFPKKIRIGDNDFEIKLDKKITGGSFKYWSEEKDKATGGGEIMIGTFLLEKNPKSVLTSIIHELKEIIQVEQGVRFQEPSESKNYEFHYRHKEHTDFCARLSGLLWEFFL